MKRLQALHLNLITEVNLMKKNVRLWRTTLSLWGVLGGLMLCTPVMVKAATTNATSTVNSSAKVTPSAAKSSAVANQSKATSSVAKSSNVTTRAKVTSATARSSQVSSQASSSRKTSSSSQATSSSVKPKPVYTTRTTTKSMKAQAFFTIKDGYTYAISGPTSHVTMKDNHKLSNYNQTTWTATAQTDVKSPNGHVTRYYLVKNARNGAQGWVATANLKAGRNYQVSSIRGLKTRNYVYAKADKVYQLSGKPAAMKWIHGKSLAKNQTYKATKQRTYYRQGKAYIYYYVTSTKGVKGWVWHKRLKPGTYYDVAKKQRAIKSQLQKYLNSVTKDGTSEVAFYNLSPVKGSKAAKAAHPTIYSAGKLAVNSRGSHVTTSASTYKLYIAAYVLHLKQQHKWSWSKANTKGMRNMILISDNNYPVSILNRYGRSNINHWLASQGYYGNPFSRVRNTRTTANSLVKVLRDLQDGKRAFSNKSDRGKVLSLMGKQVYRRGIPTGAAQAMRGTKVQDKVGFLNDNNGDAGIVTMPNGQRYILAVLTWGHHQSGFSGYPRIAKITKNVQKIVY